MNTRGELTFWFFLLWLLSLLPLPSATIPFGLIAALTPVALIVVAKSSMGWNDGLIPTGVILLVAVGVMWLGRGSVETGPWLLGMPSVTAALVIGIWLLPQLILVAGYVRTFDDSAFETASLKTLVSGSTHESSSIESERPTAAGGSTDPSKADEFQP